MSGGARSLWLPLQDRVTAWCAAAVVLAYHAVTMARDLTVYDSAELALAAHRLGLGHPPGQPLHTILGYAFAYGSSHVFGASPLVGLTLLSALPMALTVVPVMSLSEAIAPRGRAPLRAAVIAVLSVHAALWETASRVEIYALATFFVMWGTARLAALLSDANAHAVTSRRAGEGWFATGVGFGLAAAVNPVIATLAATAALPAIAVRRRPVTLGALFRAVMGGALGLVPYLYVPLVARRGPFVFVWGAPTGGTALSRFLRVADFTANAGVSSRAFVGHLGAWGVWSAKHLLLPIVVLGVFAPLALTRSVRRRRRFGLGLVFAPLHFGLAFAFIASNVLWLEDNPDYLGYLTAPLFVFVAGLAAAVVTLESRASIHARGAAWLLFATLATDAALAPPSLFARTRSHDHVARRLSEAVLEDAPPGAFVVVDSDHWVFPMIWLQEAEARRPDVVVVPFGLASSSWYWEHLFRRHADLTRTPLRGPGGSAGRVRRLLDAHPSRAVLIERIALAAELRLRVCAGRWLLEAASASTECSASAPDDALRVLLERNLADVAAGSPASDATLTQIAYDRGEALWRLGFGGAAFSSLLAGVPVFVRPLATFDPEVFERAPRLQKALPVWRLPKALGDPARNLFVAAMLLEAAGGDANARLYAAAAADLGLPEAAHGPIL